MVREKTSRKISYPSVWLLVVLLAALLSACSTVREAPLAEDPSAEFDSVSLGEPVARINAGGPSLTAGGVTWEADRYFSGGRSYSNSNVRSVASTSDDALYLRGRVPAATENGKMSYRIPVPARDTYVVRLHFAEIFWGSPGWGSSGGVGSRVFSVDIEGGAARLRNYDIAADVGLRRAVVKTYRVQVSDGVLNLDFSASKDRPKIAAIEVFRSGGTDSGSVGSGGTASSAQAVTGFTLINADTNRPISGFDPIPAGATLDLSRLPTKNLNIRANTNPRTVGSVVFGFNGNSRFRVESGAPYALFSDSGGNYHPWTPSAGDYRVTATPYSSSGGRGSAGRSLSLNFKVVAGTARASTTPSEPAPSEPAPAPAPAPSGGGLTVKVSGRTSGKSIQHIGANGTDTLNARDVRDLGISTYRIFSGMERAEPSDDNGRYGSPSIGDLKSAISRNPSAINNLINWDAFDRNMRSTGNILRDLNSRSADMQPIMVLRNSANWGNFWVPRMNVTGRSCTTSSGQRITWPNFTQADWNEWFTHVVAVVYWVNVRNGSSMRVDHWSVHNEPNEQPSQGWCGTRAQYLEFVKHTRDAIDFVYKTYLNDRSRTVLGGAVSMRSGWQDWVGPLLKNSGSSFSDRNYYRPSMIDAVAIHPYGANMPRHVENARALTRASGTPSYTNNYPIWATEMGGYRNGQWNDVPTVLSLMVNNLIAGATPGPSRVEGALLWRMYDGGDSTGLITNSGTRRPGFYALALAVKALNGGKAVHPTQVSLSGVTAITTRESGSAYNLLMTNTSSTRRAIGADVSELLRSGRAELYLFDNSRKGASSLQPLSTFSFSGGRLDFNLPPNAMVLVRFRS